MSSLPLAAAHSQGEPPAPTPATRDAVESGKAVRKGDVPAAKSLDLTTQKATPAESVVEAPAPPPTPEEEKAARAQRGHERSMMLAKLQGTEEVELEADPNNPPSVTEPVRLNEAVAFALQNNYDYQATKAKTAAGRWEYIGGYAQYLPTITYEHKTGSEHSAPGSYQEPAYNGATASRTVGVNTHHYRSRSTSIHQPLIDPTVIADILARKDSFEAVKSDELGAREKTAYDTIASFMRVTQSRLMIRFAETYKANLDKLAQRMKDRVSGGGAPGVELDRITARSTTAKSAIIEAHSEYQAAITEFRRLTGISPLKLALPESLMPTVPDSIEEVLDRTVKHNPDYLAANQRAEATLSEMRKSFATLLPKFSLEVSDTRTWNAGGVANTPGSVCTLSSATLYPNNSTACTYPYANTRQVLGTLTWQLNGGTDITNGMSYRERARAASFSATDTRQKLEESARVGYDALNAAVGRIDAVRRASEANTKVAVSFEEQYLAGSRQLLDLLDAYERLYTSQTELTRLLVAESTASYLVRRQMGDLVSAILSSDEE